MIVNKFFIFSHFHSHKVYLNIIILSPQGDGQARNAKSKALEEKCAGSRESCLKKNEILDPPQSHEPKGEVASKRKVCLL